MRVLVCDRTRMESQLLAEVLERDSRLHVVRSSARSAEVVAAVGTERPNVVLISSDLDQEPLRGLEVARKLHSSYPEVNTVVLLDTSNPDTVIAAFAAGASGVFCRSELIDALPKCVYSVHQGQVWADSREMRYMLRAFADAVPQHLVDANGVALLSRREQDVVRCVTEGLTNRQIAATLNLSEHTVKNYIFRIFDKLGVSTRVEMVLYAFSQRTPTPPARETGAAVAAQAIEVDQDKAVDDDNAAGQFALAKSYREGQGAAKDSLVAYTWFRIAEKTAFSLAQRSKAAREALAATLRREDVAEAEARAKRWSQQHSRGRTEGAGISRIAVKSERACGSSVSFDAPRMGKPIVNAQRLDAPARIKPIPTTQLRDGQRGR